MNTTAHTPPRRTPGFRDASMHDLFVDCCRIGPAPTRSRELFVIAVTVVLLAIVFAIIQPVALFIVVASVLVAAVMAGRWVYGERTVWAPR